MLIKFTHYIERIRGKFRGVLNGRIAQLVRARP
jgi:hypothetical protein